MPKYKQSSRRVPEPNYLLITAIIAASGVVIAAIISYFGSVNQVLLPIEATQTAEAFHTSVVLTTHTSEALKTTIAMTTQVFVSQITDTPSPSFTPSIIPTETGTPPPIETLSATPTRVEPIKYEYTVKVGDTLKQISKRYLLVDAYADAIGKANCNQSPVAGDILIIRYFYVQQGDSIDSISERFGGKPNFLRSINNLSQEVVFLPVGQLFMLPGRCGGS